MGTLEAMVMSQRQCDSLGTWDAQKLSVYEGTLGHGKCTNAQRDKPVFSWLLSRLCKNELLPYCHKVAKNGNNSCSPCHQSVSNDYDPPNHGDGV